MTEKGHRGGIKGVESDAKGMQGGLAPGSMKEGGGSHFGMAKTEGGDSRSGMEKEEGGEKEGNGASV